MITVVSEDLLIHEFLTAGSPITVFLLLSGVSGKLFGLRANPTKLVLSVPLSGPHLIFFMTQKHLEISAAGKKGYGLLHSSYQARYFCHHFNVTGQTKLTKPSSLLGLTAAAGLFNHFHFCTLRKRKFSSILNPHISPTCYQKGN